MQTKSTPVMSGVVSVMTAETLGGPPTHRSTATAAVHDDQRPVGEIASALHAMGQRCVAGQAQNVRGCRRPCEAGDAPTAAGSQTSAAGPTPLIVKAGRKVDHPRRLKSGPQGCW